MADRKITDLTALAAGSQATGDLVTIVDVSEAAAADKNKKMTMENLFKGIPGDVGIGTSSPRALVDFGPGSGDGTLSQTLSQYQAVFEAPQGTGDIGRNIAFATTTTGISAAINATDQGGSSATGIAFATGTAGSISERLRIDQSGNVGIGESTPAAGLDVKVDTNPVLAVDRGSANTANFNLQYNGTLTGQLSAANADFQVSAVGSSTPISFYANGSERMRIDSSGRFLVNTTVATNAASYADNLVVGTTSGDNGMTIVSGTSDAGSVNFSDGTGTNSTKGIIQYSHSSNDLYCYTDGSERVRIDSSGRLLVGTSSATHGSAATAEFAGTNTDYIFSLTNTTASDSEGHRFSYLAFTGTQSGGEKSILASVNGAHDGTGDDTKGMLVFRTNSGSESGTIPTERMRINRFGTIGMGTGGFDSSYRVNIINTSAGGGLAIMNSSSDNDTSVAFRNSGQGTIGSITTSNTATAYNTSSDYRLKENVVDLDGAISRVKQLAPKRFNFIADDSTTVDGFLAHEAATVVPEAVTGTHNEVDDDNNPVYQGIDQSKLVPLLTAALQEAIAKIETLETKVAALEAQ